MERICHPGRGLFPSPKEIKFDCSCPDWASMCKHVAAVFYGVGARLDKQPELLFALRKVDAQELVARAATGLPAPKRAPRGGKVLDDSAVTGIFGIEMAALPEPAKLAKKPIAKKTAAAAKKSGKVKLVVAVRVQKRGKLAVAVPPGKPDALTSKVVEQTRAAVRGKRASGK